MRQILLNGSGAVIARTPRPAVERGHVLIRVRRSMISVGTEIASIRPSTAEVPVTEQAKEYAGLARTYLGLAMKNPGKAVRRVGKITKSVINALAVKSSDPQGESVERQGDVVWSKSSAKSMERVGSSLEIVTDNSSGGYQALSQLFTLEEGKTPIVRVSGEVKEGIVSIGLLNDDGTKWLGQRSFDKGRFDDKLIFDPQGREGFTLVVANAGLEVESKVTIENVEVFLGSPTEGGLPLSELEDQGWNVGYSAAGEVIAIGAGVTGFVVGDKVACGGAGKANHADYVSVPRNLVCGIPDGVSMREAATTTVGTIALQGVRRTAPQLGESVAVLGLGLIGQITTQLLRASGCNVIGLDLSEKRVARAKTLGMTDGASDETEFRAIIRDRTGGKGVDRTVITAATKSDAVINLAMEITRMKGRVVIVGDVGLNVARAHFYKKEIDLMMSSSYGPGRYDRSYEEDGIDYPQSYVRWTLNRNMGAYMDAVATGRLNVTALIDREITIDKAPELYSELAKGTGDAPLGVIIEYPDDKRELSEPAESCSIKIRGSRNAPDWPLRYALVGAGAFGTCMLVPQMAKRKDRFFLRGVVSRDAVRGGNFARANQVELFTSSIDEVLADPDIDLVVIATRHSDHAEQVIKSLEAGKHVFVEKPLAMTWKELDRIVELYSGLEVRPSLMVGFNRRFSPAMTALMSAIEGRRSPLIMHYRLNGGFIPADSWIHGPQGGGRNIGEACHMYDVFRSLAKGPVTAVTASAINPGDTPYQCNDNFCATVTYEDGSVGNLVYTALGPKQGLPKERVEVYCDGEVYILDDYKSLTRASDGEILWQSDEVDKGHFSELSLFGDSIAQNGEPPISFDDIVETTAVALTVEDLITGVETLHE